MVTQLLFGDLVVVNGSSGNWLNIRNIFDNYEGWADKRQIQFIDEHEFNHLKNIEPEFITDLVEVVQNSATKELIPVLMGSALRRNETGSFSMDGVNFIYTGRLTNKNQSTGKTMAPSIIEFAMSYLNAPYLWGGKSPFGIDCSGFVQVVFMMHGIHLSRDAAQQANAGENVSLLDEAQTADLLFFDNDEGKIVHVGILLNDSKIIHASGKVRIDMIDHQGIYNHDQKKYTHKLRLIRRIL
jgi:hypothetical protein